MAPSVSKQEIEELACKAKKGCRDSYGKLFEILSDELFRYCVLQVRSVPDAQDILSETFKKSWSYIKRYRKDNFRAFLYSVARNLICDYFKDKNRMGKSDVMKDEQGKETEIVESVLKEEELRHLHAAISVLPADYREIITLRFIEDLSVQEVADIMQKSPESVRVAQHRAVAKLKNILNHGR